MALRRADDNAYTLAASASATGAAVAVRGGAYTFAVDGTVGASTISLQVQSPNGTWLTVNVFNASPVQTTSLPYAQTGINLPAGNVRMAATGGTPSGLNASLFGLG